MAGLPPLREVIAEHDLRPRKSLGQHFLLDTNLCRRIARAAGDVSGATVLEVGPGPGGLTRALLETDARKVIALEKDKRCVAALAPLAERQGGRLEVVEGDALAYDYAALPPGRTVIVANLPYNIGTPLLFRFLACRTRFEAFVLMFQKEVAERITAREGRAFGRLAVKCQWLCDCEILFDVTPKAFTPPPDVLSAVVRLAPRAEPLYPVDEAALDVVTRAAFAQRRKMIRSTIKAISDEPAALLEEAGISPDARPETLSVEAFCALARAWSRASRSNAAV